MRTSGLILFAIAVALVSLFLTGCCRDHTFSYGVIHETSLRGNGTENFLGSRERPAFLVHFSPAGERILIGVSSASSNLKVVNRNATVVDSVEWPFGSLDAIASTPTFSATNPTLLLFSGESPPDSTYGKDLYLYDFSTDSLRLLTEVPNHGDAHFASFIPQSERAAYVFESPDHSTELRSIDISEKEANSQTLLTTLPETEFTEAPYDISSKGEFVTYTTGRRLMRVNLPSGTRTVLDSVSSRIFAPRLSPNDSHVLYRFRRSNQVEELVRLNLTTLVSTTVDTAGFVRSTSYDSSSTRFYDAQFASSASEIVYGKMELSSATLNTPTRIYTQNMQTEKGPVHVGTGLNIYDKEKRDKTENQISAPAEYQTVLFVGRKSYTKCLPITM